MAIITFLINLAGATMLLMFGVRLVRTGIERRFGSSFKRLMTSGQSLFQSGMIGVALAVVLQSSAAVAVLTAGFAASGYLGFPAGLAMVLGGDLGSALVIQILSFQLDWLVPLLLAVGGYMFVKTEGKQWRQLGRILMGVAFILIALRFLREAVDPIRDSDFLPAVAGYLARDYVTAFLVGAALAFIMHSSVAAILMVVTLAQIGALPFAAGMSVALGANFGSAFIPVWLSRSMGNEARRIPFANLLLRGVWAVIVLVLANMALRLGLLGDPQGGQMLVNVHLAFNASLLLLGLPLCRRLEGPLRSFLPKPMVRDAEDGLLRPVSALDHTNIGTEQQALSGVKRELIHMMDLVEHQFRPALGLYKTGDKDLIEKALALDGHVNECLSNIRRFVSVLPADRFGRENLRAARHLMEFAIRLETAGDVASKRLTRLASDMVRNEAAFSDEGWAELSDLHETILANMKLASNVLISDDLESARLLNIEKTEIKRAERESRKKHLKRLQEGNVESFETSDIHLETLRALREFHSHISSIAYPILYRNGQLLETRLIEDMPERGMEG